MKAPIIEAIMGFETPRPFHFASARLAQFTLGLAFPPQPRIAQLERETKRMGRR